MTTIQFAIHVTAKDGSEAKITGDETALDAIEAALRKGGAKWNEEVGCWDFGFYKKNPTRRNRTQEQRDLRQRQDEMSPANEKLD